MNVTRYLNNAGTSWPKAPGVAEVVQEILAQDPSRAGACFETARAGIAKVLGVEEPEQLLLTPGCTSALQVCLSAIAWEQGDTVLTSSVEHHAVLGPIRGLARLAGVRHIEVPYRPGAPFDLERYRALLRSHRVRAVVFTAASNVTGERLPVPEICGLAREEGALAVLDGAQIVGLDLRALPAWGADVVTFAGHKAPLAPVGVGGLWSAPASPIEVGFCDVGSVDLPGAAALAHSLGWLATQTPEHRVLNLRRALAEGVESLAKWQVVGSAGEHTATLSVVHEHADLREVAAQLAEEGIVARAGLHCASSACAAVGFPAGTLRFSFGPFNALDDVDAVLTALRQR